MKIRDKIKALWAKVDSIVECAVLYVGATALDFITSMGFPPGLSESNGFARHANGQFWPKHAFINNGFNTLEDVFISMACYIGVRKLSPAWAKFAAGLPWLYYGWLHLDAAFINIQYHIPGLYQRTAEDLIRSLLGS